MKPYLYAINKDKIIAEIYTVKYKTVMMIVDPVINLRDGVFFLDRFGNKIKDREFMDVLSAFLSKGEETSVCKHDLQGVWLSDDLEGYKCKKCGFETIDYICPHGHEDSDSCPDCCH